MIRFHLVTVAVRCSMMMLAIRLYLHLFLKVIQLFGEQTVVVFSKVARFLPQSVHLSVLGFGHCPNAFALTLVALAVLLDSLLNLTFVKLV